MTYLHRKRANTNHKIPSNYRYIEIDAVNTTANPALNANDNTRYRVVEVILDMLTNPHTQQLNIVVDNVPHHYALSTYNRLENKRQ